MRIKFNFDYNNQSCLDSVDPKSNARVSTFIRDGKLATRLFDDVATLYDGLRRGARVSNNGPFLGCRCPPVQKSTPYTWVKYDEAIRKCEMFGRGLVPKFCQPGQQTYIGIYAHNRPEWIIAEHACYNYSMVIVPIFNTSGLDSVRKVLSETELSILLIDTIAKLELLIENRNSFPNLKLIVLFDNDIVIASVRPELKKEADKMNLTILNMNEIIKMGENNKQAVASIPPKPSDLAVLCYTSGTSGFSRGVLLTHANFVADCASFLSHKSILFTSNDVLFSFLPSAHCFERFIEQLMIICGGAIGFSSGNVLFLGDDFYHLRPTKMPCVPNLLSRIYNSTMTQINESKMATWLFPKAFSSKKLLLEKHIICDDTIWDYVVFRKIRNYFGGRLKGMICGSAPCSAEVLTFMRVALGCVIVEGYGCTENTAAASCSLEGDFEPGHVGPPSPCNKIKLVEVPEIANIGDLKLGEICILGPTLFRGYFKDPEATTKVLDKDGWLHTGDIGLWTERGTLKIIGRRNSVFKLSQGEFIAPDKIESVYGRSQFVFQVFVCGDKHRDYIVAVVVPDFKNLKTALKPILGPQIIDDRSALCAHEVAITLISHDMREKAIAAGLNQIEQVKKITLVPEPFTVENALITPTLKLKRMACAKRYAPQIAEMYKGS